VPFAIPDATGPLQQFAAFHERAEREAGRRLTPSEADRYWIRRTIDRIIEHPRRWLQLLSLKLRLFWNGVSLSDIEHYEFTRTLDPVLRLPFVQWSALMPLALLGTLLGAASGGPSLVVALFNASWCVGLVLVFVVDRYRLPALSGLALAGALALPKLWTGWTNASQRVRVTVAALAVAVVMWTWPIEVTNESADLWGKLALTYERAGRLDEAKAAYRRAIEINPGDLRLRRALERLGVSSQPGGRQP
jgi:tetratricopeptide (TPR) repeat protein